MDSIGIFPMLFFFLSTLNLNIVGLIKARLITHGC